MSLPQIYPSTFSNDVNSDASIWVCMILLRNHIVLLWYVYGSSDRAISFFNYKCSEAYNLTVKIITGCNLILKITKTVTAWKVMFDTSPNWRILPLFFKEKNPYFPLKVNPAFLHWHPLPTREDAACRKKGIWHEHVRLSRARRWYIQSSDGLVWFSFLNLTLDSESISLLKKLMIPW